MDTLDAEVPSRPEGIDGPTATGTIVPVILSGGAGTRMWPLSREALPKQFWPLVSERTMLQETLRRVDGEEFAPPIVVCNGEHRFLVSEQLSAAGIRPGRILLEPVGRNSAPAVAVAAMLLAETEPDAVLCALPADGAVEDLRALRQALIAAAAAARRGWIVTIGVRPTRPETAYGYIEVGDPLGEAAGVFRIARFIEKPNRSLAMELAASGTSLWNSGMFVATAAKLLAELERYAPELLRDAARALAAARRDKDFVWLDRETFSACPAISLDYAVAERTKFGAVVPAELGWSDVGSWDALWEICPKDAGGNVSLGDVLLDDAEACYVRSEGTLTAVVGIKDAVVVTTPDAVLVLDRNRAQDVKRVVELLRRRERPEAAVHNRVRRPWGYYESIARGSRFQVKRILVHPGAELSLQKHHHRSEHWVVVEGSALVTLGEKRLLVTENESVFLPLGCVHRVQNPGRIPLVLIEVQCGSYLGEDDIVRLEDSYGRT